VGLVLRLLRGWFRRLYTVGSIRVPASFCGVVGFRPTTGRWSSGGVAPIAHTLDVNGPIARTVEDCTLLDAVITGGSPVRIGSSIS